MFLLFMFEEENPFPSIVLYLAAKPSASGNQYSGLVVPLSLFWGIYLFISDKLARDWSTLTS